MAGLGVCRSELIDPFVLGEVVCGCLPTTGVADLSTEQQQLLRQLMHGMNLRAVVTASAEEIATLAKERWLSVKGHYHWFLAGVCTAKLLRQYARVGESTGIEVACEIIQVATVVASSRVRSFLAGKAHGDFTHSDELILQKAAALSADIFGKFRTAHPGPAGAKRQRI
jgi:hypothetical protein